MVEREGERQVLPRRELALILLLALRESRRGRDILDVEIEGDGAEWGVSLIHGPARDVLPHARWEVAAVEALLQQSFSVEAAAPRRPAH